MKSGSLIALIGFAMTVGGLVMFYSLDDVSNSDGPLRTIKHSGTFIGLMGIGVIVAGVLLYLINRPQPANNMDMDLGT